MASPLHNRSILLIVSGSVAAQKAPDLVARLRAGGASVRCVLTAAGARFVEASALETASVQKVFTDLWATMPDGSMSHINLSREADLVLVAPASANIIGKKANGLADDLASTLLLAANKPVYIAPAMNVEMWADPAVQRNVERLRRDGIRIIGPAYGDLACGEVGEGRMSEPADIVAALEKHFTLANVLKGRRALVTSGPTFEPIDPVRFIGNRSSGKQGHAMAEALALAGAEVVLITGPVNVPDPAGVHVIRVETAQEMLTACEATLPVDIAVCAAAVADWRANGMANQKLKKDSGAPLRLELVENPDILATLAAAGNRRPRLVIGFAAETENLLENARKKLLKRKCDWILANDVSGGHAFGAEENTVTLLRRAGDTITAEEWPRLAKTAIAARLVGEIAATFASAHARA